MIILHVEVANEDLAVSVIQFLLQKKLVYTATYAQVNFFEKGAEKQRMKNRVGYMIRAKTKALLFQKIQKSLEKEFKKRIQGLYATPIVYMERKQAELLKSGTLTV